MDERKLVIVPTYNEAENILSLLTQVTSQNLDLDILVVDDNSPDFTSEIVRAFSKQHTSIHLLERQKKQGLGAAYIAGFLWGLEREYDLFVQMDADLSHDPSDLGRLLESAAHCDGVIGCRYIEGGAIEGWGLARRVLSRFGNFYARNVLSLPLHDLTGGFNCWRRNVLENIQLTDISIKGYSFLVELKYRAFEAGFRLKEIPILFRDRRLGTSKMSTHIIVEAALKVLQMRYRKSSAFFALPQPASAKAH